MPMGPYHQPAFDRLPQVPQQWRRQVDGADIIASRFGGSHAQRDVIELTLIEAAIRSGDHGLALRLTGERERARHDSPLSGILRRRAEALRPADSLRDAEKTAGRG